MLKQGESGDSIRIYSMILKIKIDRYSGYKSIQIAISPRKLIIISATQNEKRIYFLCKLWEKVASLPGLTKSLRVVQL